MHSQHQSKGLFRAERNPGNGTILFKFCRFSCFAPYFQFFDAGGDIPGFAFPGLPVCMYRLSCFSSSISERSNLNLVPVFTHPCRGPPNCGLQEKCASSYHGPGFIRVFECY
eukprot:4097224-Amphidinium_carterae.1